MLVFAISGKLDFVALLSEAAHYVTFAYVLFHEASEVQADGDDLLVGDLVLQLAVDKVQHIVLTKYFLYLLATVLPHDQQVRRALDLRLAIKHFRPEPYIILEHEQPCNRHRKRDHEQNALEKGEAQVPYRVDFAVAFKLAECVQLLLVVCTALLHELL